MRLGTFTLTAIDVAQADIDALHALSIGVGWPHRADDWRMLIALGHGFGARDEIGRIVGSAMWFPQSDTFATIGMVITSPRLQARGAAGWLMERVMAATGPRALRLNATSEAHRLYHTLGFRDVATVRQFNGRAQAPSARPPTDAVVRPIRSDDHASIAALDARACGTPRPALVARLLADATGTVLLRDGRIAAFALCRRFGRGRVIGPVAAAADSDAIAVAAPHVAAEAGGFLRVDTGREEGAFPAFLAGCGLKHHDTVTTMSFGQPLSKGTESVYALAGHALG